MRAALYAPIHRDALTDALAKCDLMDARSAFYAMLRAHADVGADTSQLSLW